MLVKIGHDHELKWYRTLYGYQNGDLTHRHSFALQEFGDDLLIYQSYPDIISVNLGIVRLSGSKRTSQFRATSLSKSDGSDVPLNAAFKKFVTQMQAVPFSPLSLHPLPDGRWV